MLRVLSLFSGIGAFEVALDELGIDWELDHYCEIDKFACLSYNQIHGTTDDDNLKDVENIDYSKLGNIDLITYGFPCQDISLAGNQKGFYDDEGNLTRSGLFFNAAEVIKNTKPKFAIFENVKNLTGKKMKAEFEAVLSTLDEIGYNTYWQVLNAKDYGIPQNRERVFGISIRKDIDRGYTFPEKQELKLRLKDMLESVVDENFYLSEDKVQNFIKNGDTNTTNKDKGPKILEPKVEQVGNIVNTGNWDNPQRGRIYSADGISPTLNCMQGGGLEPKILEPYYVSKKGCKYILDPKRGMCTDINEDIVQPLTAKGQQNWTGSFVSDDIDHIERSKTIGGTEPTKIHMKNGDTIDYDGNNEIPSFRIRKLTPRECWRLMGFDDKYFDRVHAVSNTQLYKQAGNSIVVDVLRAIFRELKNQYPEYFETIWGEDL